MTESLNCNAYGAPLDVPVSANYVKCNHCQGQLLIRRSKNATFSEVVDGLVDKTHSIQEQLDELRCRQAVTDLDAKWARDRERYYIDTESGKVAPPTPKEMDDQDGYMKLGLMLWFTALGVMNFVALSDFSRGGFSIIPFDIFACVGTAVMYSSRGKLKKQAADFAAAKADYQAERKKLFDQIEVNEATETTSAKFS